FSCRLVCAGGAAAATSRSVVAEEGLEVVHPGVHGGAAAVGDVGVDLLTQARGVEGGAGGECGELLAGAGGLIPGGDGAGGLVVDDLPGLGGPGELLQGLPGGAEAGGVHAGLTSAPS